MDVLRKKKGYLARAPQTRPSSQPPMLFLTARYPVSYDVLLHNEREEQEAVDSVRSMLAKLVNTFALACFSEEDLQRKIK